MDAAPALPTRFPCWCRAIYSWGGESKKDLGFIEGDLIECLNAGDGQWWMGRLRRDKRAMGMFPSNFVKVLDESFKPVSRGTSPMTSTETTPPPSKKDKSVFRKPFQAYSAVLPEKKKPDLPAVKAMRPISRGHERRGSAQKEARPARVHQLRDAPSRQDSNRSYVSDATYKNFSHQSSQRSSMDGSIRQYGQHARRDSYQPYDNVPSQQNSYMPYDNNSGRQNGYQPQGSTPSRQNSYQQHEAQYSYPAPVDDRMNNYMPSYSSFPDQSVGYPSHGNSPLESTPPPPPPQHLSRVPSPAPASLPDDGPPPPPPPHRVAYNTEPSRAPSPAMHNRHPAVSRTPSPMPHSAHPGMTPSPLRDAMDDVLDSLQDMSTDMNSRQDDDEDESPAREPLNPWSPEAFEELRTNSRRKTASRAQTSMGLGGGSSYAEGYNATNDSGYSSQNSTDGWRERMENRLRANESSQYSESIEMPPPPPTRKYGVIARRLSSSGDDQRPSTNIGFAETPADARKKLKSRKSAYELGKDVIGRTFTIKSSSSDATQSTNVQSNSSEQSNHTLMSGYSAGGFSATSAGSYARRRFGSFKRQNRPMSVAGTRPDDLDVSQMRPPSQHSGPSYHSSHPSQNSAARPVSAMERPAWASSVVNSGNPLGGLTQAKPSSMAPPQLKSKRSGFLRKLVDSAKAGAASARSTMASSPEKETRRKSVLTNGVTGVSSERSAAEDMGLGGGVDWMQFRRDVNRSNSLSAIERQERQERCDMMSQPVIAAVDALTESIDGEEGLDGMPITDPTDFQVLNMQLVDKASRFVTNLPPMTTPTSLAQGHLCRPYRSDVQRLRAIFTWVSERIAWEEDYDGEIDTRRVIQSRRGCPAEVAALVLEMCEAVGIHAEAINGFLKPPGEVATIDKVPRPNHWWNSVLVDGEWRIMDCSLASPTNPSRSRYTLSSSQSANSWYFLVRPLEACYTHIPSHVSQQHLVPPVSPEILMALPCACPPYFKHSVALVNYDTSLLFLSDLDVMQIDLSVASDIEVHAEVETRAYARDPDGDTYESGGVVTKRALAQPQWVNGNKRYTVKAILPGDEGFGKLKIYAGKRGLMHSAKDNPHSLALSLPMVHSGQNPPYDFFLRHPTPHAQRHDLYVTQPQCYRLTCGNTFVFAVRQHPSSIPGQGPSGITASSPAFGQSTGGAISPLPFRPGSAMSMTSSSASGSNYGLAASSTYSGSSAGQGGQKEKPAKLAVQTPSGKIMRMIRKTGDVEGEFDGGTWEAYIKVGEKGTWRGLVLADRSARWCVFGEWECV